MPYYIKVRKNVSDILGLSGTRAETKDGCRLLWQGDAALTGYPVIADAAAAMGGALLTPQQARMETLGTIETPLPEPQDPKYAEGYSAEEEENDTDAVSEGNTEDTPAEGAES